MNAIVCPGLDLPALREQDLDEGAVHQGVDFLRNLFGVELIERLALLDGLPLGLLARRDERP